MERIGAIYYTDSLMEASPIIKICREQIKKVFKGELVSVSLKPLDFGQNIALEGKTRSYPTMVLQIITALEASTADYVYFLEHDVIYSASHFLFTPSQKNIFYYNENILRWRFGSNVAITYDRMLPLSCLCVNRLFALEHYRMRQKKIVEMGWDKDTKGDPIWMRKMGFEPGTKKKKRGGLTDDDFETWRSESPVIDIRHSGAFSPPKCTLESFKHLPTGWKERKIEEIEEWDLKKLFNI